MRGGLLCRMGGQLLGDALNGRRLRSKFGKGAVGSLTVCLSGYLVVHSECFERFVFTRTAFRREPQAEEDEP